MFDIRLDILMDLYLRALLPRHDPNVWIGWSVLSAADIVFYKQRTILDIPVDWTDSGGPYSVVLLAEMEEGWKETTPGRLIIQLLEKKVRQMVASREYVKRVCSSVGIIMGQDIETIYEFESTSNKPITRQEGRVTMYAVASMINEEELSKHDDHVDPDDKPVVSLYVNEVYRDALRMAIPKMADLKRLLLHIESGYSYKYWEGPTE